MRMRQIGVLELTPEIKLLVTVDEAAEMLSVGRSLAWELVRRNEVRSVKVGRTRRVVVASLREYIAGLMGQAS